MFFPKSVAGGHMGPPLLKHKHAQMIRNWVVFLGVKNDKWFVYKGLKFFCFFRNSKIVSSQLVLCGALGLGFSRRKDTWCLFWGVRQSRVGSIVDILVDIAQKEVYFIDMTRIKRITKGGLVYHVLNRANGRLRIFNKDLDFLAFEKILAEGIERYSMRLCSYCIMSNHWHMLLWPEDDESMPAFMHWVTMTHTKRWHAAHGTTGIGHVYQDRYKSFPVQINRRYFNAMRYVEANPLTAKLVTDAADWKWSSYARRNDPSRPFNLSDGPMQFPGNWAEFVAQPFIEQEAADFKNCIKRGSPYGEKEWVEKTAEELNLQSTLIKRGRPRKYPES